jgi:hypothetical protein
VIRSAARGPIPRGLSVREKTVLVTIDLPEDLVAVLENRGREGHSSLQDVAIAAISKDIANFEREIPRHHRARLPLVRSANPFPSFTNERGDRWCPSMRACAGGLA